MNSIPNYALLYFKAIHQLYDICTLIVNRNEFKETQLFSDISDYYRNGARSITKTD